MRARKFTFFSLALSVLNSASALLRLLFFELLDVRATAACELRRRRLIEALDNVESFACTEVHDVRNPEGKPDEFGEYNVVEDVFLGFLLQEFLYNRVDEWSWDGLS